MSEMRFEVEIVAGTAAIARRQELLAEGLCYPVIAGAPDDLDLIAEDLGEADAAAQVAAARALDVTAWLAERVREDPDYYEEQHGHWPADAEPIAAFTGPIDILTGEPLPEVAIIHAPAVPSWQVPCLLNFGGWNECPGPVEHGAMLKRWQERYGAALVTMKHDTIELAVERPVTTREQALALASEQYSYCADIVQQGTETIEGLAATLLGAPVWFFWWD